MKNLFKNLCVFAILLTVCSCEKQEIEQTDAALHADQVLEQDLKLVNPNNKVLKDETNAYDYVTNEEVPGAFSKLWRRNKEVSAVIHSTGLEAKAAYTVWMVFENPELCSDNSCGPDDIFDMDGMLLMNPYGTFGTLGVNVSVQWVDGKVISASGNATFTFKAYENNPPGEVLFGPGLTAVMESEIHFVIRNHGQVIPDLLEMQISTFSGGCEINECTDEQYAIHLAPS